MIPLNDLKRQDATVRQAVEDAILEVARSGWYIFGPKMAAFEEAFAARCGMAYGLGVGSGTDALEMALRALDTGPGDEVITVANAGGYSTVAILTVGATPVYVDIEEQTMSMDPAAFKAALTPRTRAVVVTHLYGYPADLSAILPVADRANLPVIEDCAQAHGASHQGKPVGGFGLLSCFSFYPTKNLGALGDGGMVMTSDAGLADQLRRLRQYGWQGKYQSAGFGRNSRLDELQAAVLLAKLPYLDAWNAARRGVLDCYLAAAPQSLDPPPPPGEGAVAHLAVFRSPMREAWREAFLRAGVATDVHYPIPDYRQGWPLPGKHPPLPNTEKACAQVFSLPCFAEMTPEEVDLVCLTLQQIEAGMRGSA